MHWYFTNGQPCFELPNKSKPGVMRSVTLRDAKAMSLIPSVTTIQKAANKPALDHWKLSNAVLATISNPKPDSELVDAYIERMIEESESKSLAARDIGSGVHDYIESVLMGKILVADYSAYAKPAIEWYCKEFADKKMEFEKHIPVTYYAGRCDACGENTVIDWKTQGTKGGKFNYYPEMPEQLAAYAKALGYQKPRLISAMISTTEMGLFEAKEWGDQFPYWYASFEALYKVWSVRNNYGLCKLPN